MTDPLAPRDHPHARLPEHICIDLYCPTGAPDAAALDVDAIEAKWLQMCGYCDAGMQTYCRCPEEDHRVVISDLLAEIRRLRDV